MDIIIIVSLILLFIIGFAYLYKGVFRQVDHLKTENQNLKFLNQAARYLLSSSDYTENLKHIAASAIPAICDWVTIDLKSETFETDQALERVIVVHKNPEIITLVNELETKYPTDPSSPYGVHQVIRSGKHILMPEIPDELLRMSAKDEEHLRIILNLKLKSYVVIPIKKQEETIGAITFVSDTSGKIFTEHDVALGRQLAEMCSLGIQMMKMVTVVQSFNIELEENVKQRTHELEASNKELESFSYSVSHDLRAPLRHMFGFTKLLKNKATEQLSPELLKYINYINQAAEKLGILIDELLNFSRVGRYTPKFEPVNVNTLIAEVKKLLNKEKYYREDIHWEEQEIPLVEADLHLFGLVIQNLLSNAIKYSSKNDDIHIKIMLEELNKEWVTFAIKDNGVGFDMDYTENLFGTFQRMHTEEEFEGIGIGLANVKRIINKHAGEVWAEAEEGKGASFFIKIKRAKETA